MLRNKILAWGNLVLAAIELLFSSVIFFVFIPLVNTRFKLIISPPPSVYIMIAFLVILALFNLFSFVKNRHSGSYLFGISIAIISLILGGFVVYYLSSIYLIPFFNPTLF